MSQCVLCGAKTQLALCNSRVNQLRDMHARPNAEGGE